MTTALVGGTVFDGTGRIIPKGVVVIEGETIATVSEYRQADIPAQANQIDASGKFIMPGLIDAHNHLGLGMGNVAEQMAVSDGAVTLRAIRNAQLHLASGVTTMRSPGERNFLDIEWRDAFASDLLTGPRLVASGPGITATHGHGREMSWLADGEDEVRKAVRTNIRHGVDWIKIFTTGSRATADTEPGAAYYTKQEIIAAVDEAHRMGRPVGTHCHGGIAMQWALEAGVDAIEHGASMSDENIATLLAKNVPLVVTLGVYFSNNPGPNALDPIPPKNVQAFASIKRAIERGVRIAVGGDTRHTSSTLVFELECLIECGLTNSEALISATSLGAEVSGLADALGTLTPGKRADIIALDNNPLEDIQALRGVQLVMKGGHVYHNELPHIHRESTQA